MIVTERRQQQTIRDLMADLEVDLDRVHLRPPYSMMWEDIVNYSHDFETACQVLNRMALRDESLRDLVEIIRALPAGWQPEFDNLANVTDEVQDVNWLWTDWLPRGYMSALVAWPGAGKTYLAIEWAHRLISDLPTPDGQSFQRRSGNIIFVDAEDMLSAIYQRATAWGVDGSKFHLMRRPPLKLMNLAEREHQEQLLDMCHYLQPDLIIIDSFSQINPRGENTVEDIREIMDFLAGLPKLADCAELVIFHPRKPAPGLTQPISMYDLRGSSHIQAVARAIIGMDVLRDGPDDNPNGPRRIKMLKSNFGMYPKPLHASYKPMAANPSVADISYTQQPYFADETDTVSDEAGRWLEGFLIDGPRRFTTIQKHGENEGYSINAILRARSHLNGRVIDTIGPKRRGNKWALLSGDEENK